MMEKLKSAILAVLVALSLVQSYFLTYQVPGLGATVRTEQDYVNAEPMGREEQLEHLVFPEQMVLHFGRSRHTVLHPDDTFYNLIYGALQSREFGGFRRETVYSVDWDVIRDRDTGVELRFGTGIPVELLRKSLKLDDEPGMADELINRIWIYKKHDSDEVMTYFFSADGRTVFEAVKADLTVSDVDDYVGFGEYWTLYEPTPDGLYIPTRPVKSVEAVIGYETYSPELMRRNLFFDPAVTRALEKRGDSQIYTDGKRGLRVEQDGKWLEYTDPAAPQEGRVSQSEHVYASVQFVNEHGGWDGRHRLASAEVDGERGYVEFQQYYGTYPIVTVAPFRFGYMSLTLQQGVVVEYERSLITLRERPESKQVRWLPGGEALERALQGYDRRSEVKALYPALQALPAEEGLIRFEPVWAVRLTDGTQHILLGGMPPSFDGSALGTEVLVQPDEEAGAGEDGRDAEGAQDETGSSGRSAGGNTAERNGDSGDANSAERSGDPGTEPDEAQEGAVREREAGGGPVGGPDGGEAEAAILHPEAGAAVPLRGAGASRSGGAGHGLLQPSNLAGMKAVFEQAGGDG